ncbi:patatin-like phospholipase family protein [candidate division KSB1 bacterium]|nr:patatin-like phospholipase family protein [candidate division KSB1 bacterium]
MKATLKKFPLGLFVNLLSLFSAFAQSSDSLDIKLSFSSMINPPRAFIPYKQLEHPRIGLALSGGGARCICQIGVMQVLEENNIPIDHIVGTSMGSVIGGLYAAGYKLNNIVTILNRIKWDDIIIDKTPRSTLFLSQKQERERHLLQLRFSSFKPYIPAGLSPGQTITNILTDLTMRAPFGTLTDFSELKIPFQAVATDLISGKQIILKNGNLAEAMCASLAFPLLFTPVRQDSMLLVDGGLTNNIPVSETFACGADIVIAVDATSDLRPEENIQLPWEVVDQATSIMQRAKNQEQRELADLTLRFENSKRLSSDFSNLDSVVECGRKMALDHLDQLKQLIHEKTLERSKASTNARDGKITINSVQISGLSHLPAGYIDSLLQPIMLHQMEIREVNNVISKIYATGYFSNVRGKLLWIASSTRLLITVDENPVLRDIDISGNTAFPDSILIAQFENKPGSVLNHLSGMRDIQSLILKYRRKGYSLADIKEIWLDDLNVLHIEIDEGRIKQIILDGNEQTRSFVIMREFPLNEGSIFNYEAAKTGMKNIYGTGLFNTVRLNVIRDNPEETVIIKLDEKNFDLLRIGGRYDSERQGKAFIEFVNDNILGFAHKFGFHAQYGEKDELYITSFRADRLFKTYFTYNAEMFYRKNRYNTYSYDQMIGQYAVSRTGLDFSAGQQMRRLGTLSIEGKIHHIKYRSLAGYGYPVESLDLKILRISSIVDTQDQFPFPTKGKYNLFYYEFSSAEFLTSEESYNKLFSSLETYSTFFKHHTLHPKLVWGTSDLTTPYSEQYYLGGQDSFLGLRDRQLVGRYLMSASLEYRFNIPGKMVFDSYLHVIGAAAGIWEKEVDIKSKDFLFSIGLKASAMTPLGPISLAYGRMNDGRSRFYLSAGYSF